MDLVLVGLPGSGKTAVGRRLAQRHGAAFVDLDDLVERRAGSSVTAIFAAEGETGFRRHEREAVLSLGPADPDPELRRVIASGGGAVIDPLNRWLLYRGRFPVWLDGAPEILASRLGRSSNVRPLIAGSHPLESLRNLAEERRRFYAPALQLSGTSNVDGLVKAIESRLGDGPSSGGRPYCGRTRPIGRVEIGQGIAAEAVSAALTPCRSAPRDPSLRAEGLGRGRGRDRGRAGGGRLAGRARLPASRRECQAPVASSRRPAAVLARLRVDRGETLVAIGGGALTDAAGLAAAMYLRGVADRPRPHRRWSARSTRPWAARRPWTCPEGKNLVGAFHQPTAFVADVAFLATLPPRQRRAALGEVVKMAVLGDERLLELRGGGRRGVRPRRGGAVRVGRRGRDGRALRLGQGRGRHRGRARVERAHDPQPGPHDRPRYRGGGRLQGHPPRRGSRLRASRRLRDRAVHGPHAGSARRPGQRPAGSPGARSGAAGGLAGRDPRTTWPPTRSTSWAA